VRALIEGEATGAGGSGSLREAVKAQALIEKAERLLESAGPEDVEDLVNGIEAVRDALAAEGAGALEQATADLPDLIFFLET
jgi:class 3 adenylate cyclase